MKVIFFALYIVPNYGGPIVLVDSGYTEKECKSAIDQAFSDKSQSYRAANRILLCVPIVGK